MSKSEYDVSKIAWETYRLLYKDNFENFTEKGKRPYIDGIFTLRGKKTSKAKFSGETDFNFKKGFAHTRGTAYFKHLENSKKEAKCIKGHKRNFNICKKLMYSVVNISIMPQTGNIQGTKGNIGNDRIDTFVYAIENYHNGIDNLLMNYSSADNSCFTKEYFKMFSNTQDYCATMYHINESLVDELIKSGKNVIKSDKCVIQYMNLAYRFWRQKLIFFNSQGVSNSMRQELDRVTSLLDNWFWEKE